MDYPMNIYSYFDSSTGFRGQAELIATWQASWQRHGWTPSMLTPRHASRHPRYQEFLAKINTLPTVNVRAYENACYLRWLALDQVGGGFMCDYDVMNYGLKPYSSKISLDFFHPQYIPAFVYANKAGCKQLINEIIGYQPAEPHVSDMIVIMKLGFRLNGGKHKSKEELICCEYGDDKFDWLHKPTLHFAAGAVHAKHGQISKVDAIRRCPR